MGWLGDRPSGVSGAGDGSEQREAVEAERGRERVGGGGGGGGDERGAVRSAGVCFSSENGNIMATLG